MHGYVYMIVCCLSAHMGDQIILRMNPIEMELILEASVDLVIERISALDA